MVIKMALIYSFLGRLRGGLDQKVPLLLEGKKGRVGGTTIPNGAPACRIYTVGEVGSKLGPFANLFSWRS